MTSQKRNDPCACGSGRQYKNCCLNTVIDSVMTKETVTQEAARQKICHLSSDIIKRVEAFSDDIISPELIAAASMIFLCDHDDLPESILLPIMQSEGFLHWFYFRCVNEPGEEETVNLGQHFAQEEGGQLDRVSRDYLNKLLNTYYSFYQVIKVNPGKSVLVKDLLLGKTYLVHEKRGSKQMKVGHVLFGSVLHFLDIFTFVGIFGVVLPADIHLDLVMLQESVKAECGLGLNSETITQFQIQELIRQSCFDILASRYSNKPHITNSDGQSYEFNEVTYKINTSLPDVLKKLQPMFPPDETVDSMMANMTKGTLEFPWLDKQSRGDFGFPVLGHVTLSQEQLILESNSTNRSARLQILLEDYLKQDVSRQTHTHKPLQEGCDAVDSHTHLHETCIPIAGDLTPEAIQEYKDAMLANYDTQWIEKTLPALNGLTPKEAARNPSYRDRLEALINDIEARDPTDTTTARCTKLRQMLGLIA